MCKIPDHGTGDQYPHEGHAADGGRPVCPSWCEDRDRDDYSCRGEHRGKAWGTVASAGLPPIVDSIEPPNHDTVLVRPEFDEVDSLPRGVALFGSMGGSARSQRDYEVALTIKEARPLAVAEVGVSTAVPLGHTGRPVLRVVPFLPDASGNLL